MSLPDRSDMVMINEATGKASSDYMKIRAAVLDGFGAHRGQHDLILYLREAVHWVFAYLQEDVLLTGDIGYISGPAGTGKSCAAVAFAVGRVNQSEWVVTWIHLVLGGFPIAVRLESNVKKTLEVRFDEYLRLDDILELGFEGVGSTKKHLLFVDNVTETNDTLMRACVGWARNDKNRRLVFVSPTVNKNYRKMLDQNHVQCSLHRLTWWRLDDYMSALQNQALLQHVLPQLDASEEPLPPMSALEPSRIEALARSKLYFTGGNVRYMFDSTTMEVVEDLLDTLGRRGESAVVSFVKEGPLEVLCPFVPVLIAIAWNVAAFSVSWNFMALDSHWVYAKAPLMLETFFFSRLKRSSGVRLYERRGDEWCELHWLTTPVNILGRDQIEGYLEKDEPLWLKLLQHNRGSFDAVYLDRGRGLVRLVRIAGGHENVLSLEYFVRCGAGGLSDFEFASVSGGELMQVFPGWELNEGATNVRRVGIDSPKKLRDF
ncbi:hypothetical protein Poli38472_006471 [Pythium oligandrum]|uniref:Uncharacterized protein n=1 Tax=Pythium oligandrum TaxID=41045 RepID=A0A8K1FBU1_PYTOL|nr:hypothetical protein Poli38472_006471 [Pythium oligandrum]|eukprot:TMW56461.1 hypothetical protein Poli38472_006471 [Pythium oligandrum]